MRIILADDHHLVRDSLKQYLELLGPNVEILEGATLPEVLTHAGEKVDLVVMDLQMPGMAGPRSIADVRAAFPATPVVVVSGVVEPAIIRAVIQNGANGYIPKTARGKSLVNAINMVLAGETYLPTALLMDQGGAAPGRTKPEADEATSKTGSDFDKLSTREAGVLRLLIAGKANKEIARDLDLQEVTVKVHLRNIYRKIQASSRTDAVRLAMTAGWH